jgi:hypothetical protein
MRIKADIGSAARAALWCAQFWQAQWSLVQRGPAWAMRFDP